MLSCALANENLLLIEWYLTYYWQAMTPYFSTLRTNSLDRNYSITWPDDIWKNVECKQILLTTWSIQLHSMQIKYGKICFFTLFSIFSNTIMFRLETSFCFVIVFGFLSFFPFSLFTLLLSFSVYLVCFTVWQKYVYHFYLLSLLIGKHNQP